MSVGTSARRTPRQPTPCRTRTRASRGCTARVLSTWMDTPEGCSPRPARSRRMRMHLSWRRTRPFRVQHHSRWCTAGRNSRSAARRWTRQSRRGTSTRRPRTDRCRSSRSGSGAQSNRHLPRPTHKCTCHGSKRPASTRGSADELSGYSDNAASSSVARVRMAVQGKRGGSVHVRSSRWRIRLQRRGLESASIRKCAVRTRRSRAPQTPSGS